MTPDQPRGDLITRALPDLKHARAEVRGLLDDDGFNATLPSSVRQRLRQVHTELDIAIGVLNERPAP